MFYFDRYRILYFSINLWARLVLPVHDAPLINITILYTISIFCHFLLINLLVDNMDCRKKPEFNAHHIPAA